MSDRKAFEQIISSPPYEKSVARWPDDPEKFAWPGSYKLIDVDLAWHLWCDAVDQEREACALACENEHVGIGVTDLCDNNAEDASYNAALRHAAESIRARKP
jgi:hypothetical protein